MQIVATFSDGAINQLATRLAGFEAEGRATMAATLNAVGEALRHKTVIAETAQTGLAESTIDRAQTTIDASPGRLAFTVVTEGGNVRLKYFGAKEGGGGVTATPWNRSTFYGGAFLTSGRPGARALSPKLGGQVYTNIGGGKWGGKIAQERSGLYIPTELTKGNTASTFEAGAGAALEGIMTKIAGLIG
jgi:hypothetical protein